MELTNLFKYGNDSSWGLSYNMFADKLLKTNVFPQSLFDLRKTVIFYSICIVIHRGLETAWYKTVFNAFGRAP